MGWPQLGQRNGARGLTQAVSAVGMIFNTHCNNAISRLLLGCGNPKLRARRKPLGNTGCISSHKKGVPLTVRIIVFPVLASRYRKLTCPLSQRKMSFS